MNAVSIAGTVLVCLAHVGATEKTSVVMLAEAFCYGHLDVDMSNCRVDLKCPSMAHSKT